MTASWPASLPQFVQQQGYQESLPDQTIESEVDSGPAKTRRRFTKNLRPIQASIWVDMTQKATFEFFHNTTLDGGTAPFLWVNPLTQAMALFRFRRPPPAIAALGPDHAQIAMNLYQLTQYTAFRFDSTLVTFDSTLVSFDAMNLY